MAVEHLPDIDVYPSWAAEYLEHEREAIALSSYQNQVLPGLLQTEAYARAVFRSRVPVLSGEEIEEQCEARLKWFKSSDSGSDGGDCVEIAYDWRKSSYSSEHGGACVEIAAHPQAVHVRDSKDPEGPVLTFTTAAWAEFTAFAASATSQPRRPGSSG